ncbi:MAG: hypothetical protein U1F68_00945 [Gammaproteobacteria bacterium]
MPTQFPEFEGLTSTQKELLNSLGDGGAVYSTLTDKQKAGFLNITAALAAVGISTAGLRLKILFPTEVELLAKLSGIQQDRLLFESTGVESLKRQLEARFDKKKTPSHQVFIKDIPSGSEHSGMDQWGGRQWVTTCALQIGGGLFGAFVDIDEFGLRTDAVGALGHGFEVIRNKGFFFFKKHLTDPFKIGKGLRQRGVDIKYAT